MKLALVSDAWAPQVNGVVRTLKHLQINLEKRGVDVHPINPSDYRTMGCPTYPEIRLALTTPGTVASRLQEISADHVHIATEGPLGILSRRWCRKNSKPFTTSFHTRFPEYLAARVHVPASWTYKWMANFHNAGVACFVATKSLEHDLRDRGFKHLVSWTRGVDANLFTPARAGVLSLPRPIFLYVGRVAVEKNIEAFLDLDLPGTKLVVGDGPALLGLKKSYPQAVFVGKKEGEELAQLYASSDVFVFPSLTDTFGIVLLEALAAGLPVAAFPVTGPLDVVGESDTGVLDNDLQKASLAALDIPKEKCRAYALNFSWEKCADIFLQHISAANAQFKVQS
ncbi:MAG: glycosyltransferase family 4 protein [Hyphomicrobiales bacterium]